MVSSLLLLPNWVFHFEKMIYFRVQLAQTICFLNFSHSVDLLASTVQSRSMCCKKKCKKKWVKWIQLHWQKRGSKSQRCLHIWMKVPKVPRPLSCMVVMRMYTNDGKWHFKRILIIEMLSMKEKTHISLLLVPVVVSSCCSPKLPCKITYPAL